MSASIDPIFVVRIVTSTGEEFVGMEQKIISMSYTDEESKTDKLVLKVNNFDLTAFDDPLWLPGNKIEVQWGYDGNLCPMRECTIQKVKGSLSTIEVEANDNGVLMQKHTKSRKFENKTRCEVAEEIAEEYGYGPDRRWIEDTYVGEVQKQITQARMTDAVFLRDLARREGYEFFVDFDGFHFHERKKGQKPTRKFTYYTDPGRGDIMGWNLEKDLHVGKAGGVTLAGIDPLSKERFEVKADNSNTGNRDALGPTVEVITGISERDGTAVGDRLKAIASTAVAPTTEQTKKSAQQRANGQFKKNQMTNMLLSFDAIGDPSLVAKSVIEIQGLGKALSGNYYVTSVQHDVGTGYTMKVKCKRDGSSGVANGATVATKGKQNEGTAPPGQSWLASESGALATERDLTTLNERDGSVSFGDSRGRSNK